MNEGGICLYLESAQMQGVEEFFQTCELCSAWYKFLIGKVEKRNLLNKIFLQRNNQANSDQTDLKGW